MTMQEEIAAEMLGFTDDQLEREQHAAVEIGGVDYTATWRAAAGAEIAARKVRAARSAAGHPLDVSIFSQEVPNHA